MRVRFILGILILLLSCALQFWFASTGVFVNFILASLIVFAFFFDIWELAVFVLFAVLVVNWQPAASIDIVLFAVIPVAAYIFHRWFSFAAWIAAPAAIIVGVVFLYLAIAPVASFHAPLPFFTDLFGDLVFGALVFLTLQRLPRT